VAYTFKPEAKLPAITMARMSWLVNGGMAVAGRLDSKALRSRRFPAAGKESLAKSESVIF
jgi:hypothetical protein